MPFPEKLFDVAFARFNCAVDDEARGFLPDRDKFRDRRRVRRMFDSGWDYLEANRGQLAGLRKDEIRPYLESHLRGERENFGFPLALLLIGFKAILLLIELWLLTGSQESGARKNTRFSRLLAPPRGDT
jgi:hypothetical protein